MLPLQHGQQPLVVQALGVLEMQAHALGERLVALGNRVIQIPHGDQLAQLQIGAPVHQQLKHQFQSRALALQRGRHGNQGLHQCRRERVDLAEHVAVGRGGEQGVEHVLAHLHHVVEGALQRLPGRFVDRAQHAPLGNGGQVAVFQRDAVEARLPMLQHVAELHLHRARQVFTHQVTQVTLPRHKADQRNGAVGIGGFHQLDQLGAFAADEIDVGRMAGQPQHQLVQEQDDGVVTQRLGVAAHDAQAIVQRHERLAAARQRAVGREELRDQIAHQP